MYWWKRRSAEISIQGNSGSYLIEAQTVYYSDELVLSGSQVVSLKDPESIYVTGHSSSQTPTQDLSFLNGKYLKFSSGNFISYFCQCTGISYDFIIGSAGQFGWTANFIYFTSVSATYGDWEYVQSTSSSAYPQSGIQDGYEYVFLGQPFQNIINGAQIETGNYVGTGKYGSAESQKNSLTFEQKHGLVIIMPAALPSGVLFGVYLWGSNWMTGNVGNSNTSYQNNASVSGNTFTWYNTYSAIEQFNQNGTLYNYVAI